MNLVLCTLSHHSVAGEGKEGGSSSNGGDGAAQTFYKNGLEIAHRLRMAPECETKFAITGQDLLEVVSRTQVISREHAFLWTSQGCQEVDAVNYPSGLGPSAEAVNCYPKSERLPVSEGALVVVGRKRQEKRLVNSDASYSLALHEYLTLLGREKSLDYTLSAPLSKCALDGRPKDTQAGIKLGLAIATQQTPSITSRDSERVAPLFLGRYKLVERLHESSPNDDDLNGYCRQEVEISNASTLVYFAEGESLAAGGATTSGVLLIQSGDWSYSCQDECDAERNEISLDASVNHENTAYFRIRGKTLTNTGRNPIALLFTPSVIRTQWERTFVKTSQGELLIEVASMDPRSGARSIERTCLYRSVDASRAPQ